MIWPTSHSSGYSCRVLGIFSRTLQTIVTRAALAAYMRGWISGVTLCRIVPRGRRNGGGA